MGLYETDPSVEPLRIRSYRQLRRDHRRGYPIELEVEPTLYSDFFKDQLRRRS